MRLLQRNLNLFCKNYSLVYSSLFLVALLFWLPMDSSYQALWVERWGIVALATALFFLSQLKIPILFKASLLYFFSLAIYSFFFRQDIDPDVGHMLKNFSGAQLALGFCFIAFCSSGLSLKRELLAAAVIVGLAITISRDSGTEVFLIHNPSLAATFVVLASWCHPVSILAVAATRSWTALFALVVGLLVRYRQKIGGSGFFCLAIFAGLSLSLLHKIPDNGRFAFWSDFYSWGWGLPLARKLFGAGIGSSAVWLPFATMSRTPQELVNLSPWAHNDYLQWMIETGIVGIVLGFLCLLKLLVSSSEEDLPVALAFATAMCLNPVTHIPCTALVGWVLVQRAITRKSNNQ